MLQQFDINGNRFNGYLALPEMEVRASLLLLHAWWGLNKFIITTCDKFAEEGFLAFAPDYYDKNVAVTIDEAKSYRQKLDRKSTIKLVNHAADFLWAHPSNAMQKIGVLGVSLGAGYAIEVSRQKSHYVNAVVLYYGTGGGKFNKTQAAFMGHFAENDTWGAHTKKVNALADRIRAAGKNLFFYTYNNTEHWFAETDRPEYDRDAADLAWGRTISFLNNTLT